MGCIKTIIILIGFTILIQAAPIIGLPLLGAYIYYNLRIKYGSKIQKRD